MGVHRTEWPQKLVIPCIRDHDMIDMLLFREMLLLLLLVTMLMPLALSSLSSLSCLQCSSLYELDCASPVERWLFSLAQCIRCFSSIIVNQHSGLFPMCLNSTLACSLIKCMTCSQRFSYPCLDSWASTSCLIVEDRFWSSTKNILLVHTCPIWFSSSTKNI